MHRLSAIQKRLFGTSLKFAKAEESKTFKQGFLSRILTGDHSQDYAPTNAHSVLLANQDFLYDVQVHDVKPDKVDDYQRLQADYIPNFLLKQTNTKLVGAWKSQIGVQDRYVHMMRYESYDDYQKTLDLQKTDKDYSQYIQKQLKCLNRRENQLCLSFSFWEQPPERTVEHIYELRSYYLKPGTLIEWGNNWSRGIRARFDARVVGMFTQVGPLYVVHHMWAYKNLQARKEKRETAWQQETWQDTVKYTVPLIRKMESKILTALPYSPLK